MLKSSIGTAAFTELISSAWQKPTLKSIDTFDTAFGTNIGSRSRNEDRIAVARVKTSSGEQFAAAIVCDGVGGTQMGDIAAALAIATFLESLTNVASIARIDSLLVNIIKKCDRVVREELDGRGATTLSALLVSQDGRVAASNVGDSRIYAWTPGDKLAQISVDDTIENELKNLAVPDQTALAFHHMRGGLSQAIGEIGRTEEELRVVPLAETHFKHGALLATDGAWKSDELAFNLVAIHATNAHDVVRRVISLSAWTGAVDNVSIIAIEDLHKFATTIEDYEYSGELNRATLTAWFRDHKLVVTEQFNKPRTAKRPNVADNLNVVSHGARRVQPRKKKKGVDEMKSNAQQLVLADEVEHLRRPLNERAPIEVSTDENSSNDKYGDK